MPHRYVCIHGHFYQPPRENPWTEKIDYQDSAAPYHDWNHRINAECYRPNGLSRILDTEGWVVKLSNNYSRISFNFGPTLLSWIEKYDPVSYASIIESDRISQRLYGGHGSAMAQAYNHTILPFAPLRDKITQVKWGLYDFEKRFGRAPEGMWIPETAVDLETLEVMAEHGLKFVLLAPRQAQAVRPLEGDALWESMRGERINTRIPYLIKLQSGRTISAFFYDGPTSRAVAFEGLLNNGEIFASRLCGGYETPDGHLQLSHIATDGESYGHHHAKGDMALAYALDYIERTGMAKLTNYAQFLELCPPAHEVMLYERSSWSCIHGIERWAGDCGCNSGGHPSWNQKWRRPLREAFDALDKNLFAIYERICTDCGVTDAEAMRNDYIRLVMDRTEQAQDDFVRSWTKSDVSSECRERILTALEMQRNGMLMYTSCAWFFDEISGIETVQSLAYAARAIDLAGKLTGEKIDGEFLRILATAPSNFTDFQNGRQVYERFVLPMKMDMARIAAHYSAMSLFDYIHADDTSCYDISWKTRDARSNEKIKILWGKLSIVSKITREKKYFDVLAFHTGDYDLNIGVHDARDDGEAADLYASLSKAFEGEDVKTLADILAQEFVGGLYYLDDLVHEDQKNIVDHLLEKTLSSIEGELLTIYEKNRGVVNYLNRLNIHMPGVFGNLANFVQNQRLKRALSESNPNPELIESLLGESMRLNIGLDAMDIGRLYIDSLKRSFRLCKENVETEERLRNFLRLLLIKDKFSFSVDLGEIQNSFALWDLRQPPGQDAAIRNIISDTLKVRVTA